MAGRVNWGRGGGPHEIKKDGYFWIGNGVEFWILVYGRKSTDK